MVREGGSWPQTDTACPARVSPKMPLPPPSIFCCEADVLLTFTLVIAHPYVNLFFIAAVTPVFCGHYPALVGSHLTCFGMQPMRLGKMERGALSEGSRQQGQRISLD